MHPDINLNSLNFSNSRVLVVGDAMLDQYWSGETSRVSPEAPVPVVNLCKEEQRLGGAANVAYNIKKLGAKVLLQYCCGQDELGVYLQKLLTEQQIVADPVCLANVPTISKLRILSRGQQLVRVDREKSYTAELALVRQEFLAKFKAKLLDVDVIVLSDYAKGTLEAIPDLIAIAKQAGKLVIVDPKRCDLNLYRGVDVLKPNLAEFKSLVGEDFLDTELESKAREVLVTYDIKAIVVTKGSAGLTVISRDSAVQHIPAFSSEVYDVTGAGDTVIATLAVALSVGNDLATSAYLASHAAALVVSKIGTSFVSYTELQTALCSDSHLPQGTITLDKLKPLLASRQRLGERIVLVNGCYDVLHHGHINYLQNARALGDRLVVAVNDDASIKRHKGPERPVNSLSARMQVLASLRCVDWVVAFAEDTPAAITKEILPNILVKNGSVFSSVAVIPEAEGVASVIASGGEVKLLKETTGISSTKLIQLSNTIAKSVKI